MAPPKAPDDGKQYGKPIRYDANFKGPRKRRSCTDIICLLLFVVFLIAWTLISVYAWKTGAPEKLVNGVDSFGRRCGVDSQVANKPVLFYFDLTKCTSAIFQGCPSVCVESCPTQMWSSLPYRQGRRPFDYNDIQNNLICMKDEIKRSITNANILNEAVQREECADWYIPTSRFYSRCLPFVKDVPLASELIDTVEPPRHFDLPNQIIMSSQQLQAGTDINELGNQLLSDLENSWKYILGAACSAALIGLIYIFLLRWVAGLIIWLTLLSLIALFALFAGFSYIRYSDLKKNPYSVPQTGVFVRNEADKVFRSPDLWMFFFVMSLILGIIMLLIVIFLRKRIIISIALIKEGSKAVGSVLSSLLFPLFPWVVQGLAIAWAVVIGVNLASIGEAEFRVFNNNWDCTGEYAGIREGAPCNVTKFQQLCHAGGSQADERGGCRYVGSNAPAYLPWMHLANVFGGFWAAWFVSGISQMILAGTFATWYWTFNKDRIPFFTITISTFTVFRYHLGTVAFGSLIISICSVIRAFIEYTQYKLKKFDNALVRAIFCCLKCFFWCLEKFLKFINRNAYIMCAIHGKNFCISAKNSFNLLMRNALRVAVLDKVTDFLFFIGKLSVSGAVVAIWYFAVFNRPDVIVLHHLWLPLIIIAIFSYLIASLFFSVYTMAVNTLLLCFLEDLERNDGSRERPYYMSKNLMKILGKRNNLIDKNK